MVRTRERTEMIATSRILESAPYSDWREKCDIPDNAGVNGLRKMAVMRHIGCELPWTLVEEEEVEGVKEKKKVAEEEAAAEAEEEGDGDVLPAAQSPPGHVGVLGE